jgi:mRNA interferase MazF
MQEDFDTWNGIKKRLEMKPYALGYFPKIGEVWMCSYGKNIGFEQNGGGNTFSRPILIIKKFNNHMFWTVPLSTQQKKFDFYYNYSDINGEKVSVVLAQLKLLSVKRFNRKLYAMPPHTFEDIKQKLINFLQ